MPNTKMSVSVIAMSRTGHHAVMAWLHEHQHLSVRNVEARSFKESLVAIRNMATFPMLVLRDYPNWAASMVSYFDAYSESDLDIATDNWISHVRQAHAIPTILFHEWHLAGNGNGVRGAPSKFNGGSVLMRYEQRSDDERFRHMMRRDDALALSERVFGIVADRTENVA